MSGLKVVQGIGITFAVFALVISMAVQGFYCWQTYEVTRCNASYNDAAFDPCQSEGAPSSVCVYDDLEFRTYVGLGEGIVGILASIGFIIGFAVANIPLLWVWVLWALGITAYNSFCIYDYSSNIKTILVECDVEEFWESLPNVPYGKFFINAVGSVCAHCLVLLATVPLAGVITYTIGSHSYNLWSYELQERKRG